MMGGLDNNDEETANESSFLQDNDENQEEIDFDQLLGDAAQSQVEDEEDRDDYDFDEDESDSNHNANTLDSLALSASLNP